MSYSALQFFSYTANLCRIYFGKWHHPTTGGTSGQSELIWEPNSTIQHNPKLKCIIKLWYGGPKPPSNKTMQHISNSCRVISQHCASESRTISRCALSLRSSNPSKQHFKSFLGPCLTTRTRQQCRLNWPTLVLAVLQLFREEFGWIRKMPRIQNKQKSAKGWELVPVTNLNFRLHLLCFEKKSTPKLPLIRILRRKTSHTKKGLERFLQK